MSAELLALLGIGAGGGFLTKEAIDRLGDVGEQAVLGTTVNGQRIPGAMEIAQQGLEQTQFKPFTVRSTTGGMFGVTPTEGGGADISMTLSPEEQALQGMMMSRAQSQLGATPYGQAMGRQATQSAYGLGQDFMAQAGMPTADRANMFGGTPEQLSLSKAQEEAQNQAALMAMQQAQQEQLQQANIGSTYATLGSRLGAQDIARQVSQQQLGLGSLEAAYTPQAQLTAIQQASQLYPQLQQRAQQAGAGLFGEASMGGLEAMLGAELGRANLLGNLGSGLLGGLFTPVSQAGGGVTNFITSALSDIRLKENITKVGEVSGVNFYTWDWNEKGKEIAGNQETIGVLAQEVMATHPNAVFKGSDGYLRVNYDMILGV